MRHVIRQRKWTDDELLTDGFRYYERKKQLVLAGRLPKEHAPLRIDYDFESVYASAGDVIVYDPMGECHDRLLDYSHWSVKPDIFRDTYKKWDEPNWEPNCASKFLMEHGCRPYYKAVGIWAKLLRRPVYVQSLESAVPQRVHAGVWLAIGQNGEPWHMTDTSFRQRYVINKTARV